MSHISEPQVERVTIPMLQRWTEEGRRIVMTTAYESVAARIADPIDAIASWVPPNPS
jgi:3-methyl-2-oxobutanoate hydroxymethyltransferase